MPISLGPNRRKEKRRFTDDPIDRRSAETDVYAVFDDTFYETFYDPFHNPKVRLHSPYVITATVPSGDRTSSLLQGRISSLQQKEKIHVKHPGLLRGVPLKVEDDSQSDRPQVHASQAAEEKRVPTQERFSRDEVAVIERKESRLSSWLMAVQVDPAPQNTFTYDHRYVEDRSLQLLEENANTNAAFRTTSSHFPPLHGMTIDHNFGVAKADGVTSYEVPVAVILAKEPRWHSTGVIAIENQAQEFATKILDESSHKKWLHSMYNLYVRDKGVCGDDNYKRGKAIVQRSVSSDGINLREENYRSFCKSPLKQINGPLGRERRRSSCFRELSRRRSTTLRPLQ